MRILWIGLAVLLIVSAVGGSTRSNNDMTRIGLYFVAAAGVLWLLAILL
jgi:hypothetical protein